MPCLLALAVFLIFVVLLLTVQQRAVAIPWCVTDQHMAAVL